MNNKQRKAIKTIQVKLTALREAIDDLAELERQAYANLPEGIQNGWRGDAILGAQDALEEASNDLENANESLTQATEFKR